MMQRILRGAAYVLAGLLFSVACSRGQGLPASTTVRGFNFVAQLQTDGVKQLYVTASGHVACLDAQTGRAVWSEIAPGLRSQAAPGAGPVLADSTLVYMGGGGFFAAYGLDTKTGKLKWILKKRSPVLASSGRDTVFLSTQGNLGVIAVDAKTGKIKWDHSATNAQGTLKAIIYAQDRLYTDSVEVWNAFSGRLLRKLSVEPDAITTDGDRVFIAGDAVPLLSLDARTGNVLWKASNPLSPSPEATHYVYLAASAGHVAGSFYDDAAFDAKHGVLQVFDSKNGHLLWQTQIASDAGLLPNPISLDERCVYLLEPTGSKGKGSRIIAFDVATGKQLWTYSNSEEGFLGPIAPMGEAVLIGTAGEHGSAKHATVYALDRESGSQLWKFSF